MLGLWRRGGRVGGPTPIREAFITFLNENGSATIVAHSKTAPGTTANTVQVVTSASVFWIGIWYAPKDFVVMTEAKAVQVPDATETQSGGFAVTTWYGGQGEEPDALTEATASYTPTVTANLVQEIDILTEFNGIKGGDYVTIKVTSAHDALFFLGVRLQYRFKL